MSARERERGELPTPIFVPVGFNHLAGAFFLRGQKATVLSVGEGRPRRCHRQSACRQAYGKDMV